MQKPTEGAIRVNRLFYLLGAFPKNTQDVVDALEQKGIKEIWLHLMTETLQAQEKCRDYHMHLITGRCPIMYRYCL
jgi:predicted CoA-binding protein